MSIIQAKGSGSGIPSIGMFLKLMVVGTVVARLRAIGIPWLDVLGGVTGVLFVAPFLVILALAALKSGLGLSVPQDSILTVLSFVELPFAAVALVAGILKGDPERHLGVLTARIARKPEAARRYFARGAYLAGLGRKDEAAADFDMALKLNPKLSIARRAKDALGNYSRVQQSALSD